MNSWTDELRVTDRSPILFSSSSSLIQEDNAIHDIYLFAFNAHHIGEYKYATVCVYFIIRITIKVDFIFMDVRRFGKKCPSGGGGRGEEEPCRHAPRLSD